MNPLNEYSSIELLALHKLLESSQPQFPSLRVHRKFWLDKIDLAIMDIIYNKLDFQSHAE